MFGQTLKKVIDKGGRIFMRALPIIITALLVIHTNSTASTFNGQPKPPVGLKKYRKF